jgi:hypothetical protein
MINLNNRPLNNQYEKRFAHDATIAILFICRFSGTLFQSGQFEAVARYKHP